MKPIAVLLASLLLGACAGVTPGRVEAPQVKVADVRILELGLFEQRYALELRVQNPNRFAVPVEGLSYRLRVNGVPFGGGFSDRSVRLAPRSETRMSVELVTRTSETLQQLRRLAEEGGDSLDYALEGEVQLQGREEPLPFVMEGSLAPPRQRPQGKVI